MEIDYPKFETTLIPDEDFGNYLYKMLERQDKTRTLLVDAQTKEHLTLEQIQEKCIKLAYSLKLRGIQQEDIICVISENSLLYIIPIIASLYIGAAVHLLNPAYVSRELKHAFDITKPKMVFCSENCLPNVLQSNADATFVFDVVTMDNTVDNIDHMENLLENEYENLETFKPEKIKSRDQVAIILCSSGTSGQPKAVVMTYENMINHTVYVYDEDYIGITPSSVISLVLPGFHIFGLFLQLFGLVYGAKLVIMNQFKPDVFLKSVEEFQVTQLAIVPPLAVFLAKSPLIDNYNLTSVKDIICGAAPLGQIILDKLNERLNIKVRQMYGLTESGLVSIVRPNCIQKPNSVGCLITTLKCKIRDPESKETLAAYQPGELCIKGPTVSKGYYNNPEATKNAYDEEGFFLTGDIGYYDEDKYFYIVDRLKELIKYKGFQVAPAELESILLTHSVVQEAAVIGIPDERAGELPMAFVVIQPTKNVTEEELLDFVHGTI